MERKKSKAPVPGNSVYFLFWVLFGIISYRKLMVECSICIYIQTDRQSSCFVVRLEASKVNTSATCNKVLETSAFGMCGILLC